jgi:hypothetical protein
LPLTITAALVAALVAGEPGRWLAAGLLVWVGPVVARRLAALPAVRSLGPHLPWIIVSGVGLWLLGDLLAGHPPATRDHGVHYFQTHVLVHELLPRGQLVGWTDALNGGYPAGDGYPVLGYLWAGAAHLCSFGWVSLRTSYAWGILAVWVVGVFGVWQLAGLVAAEARRRAGDRLPLDPAWAGAGAALLFLVDPGHARQGGWHYVMFHGVWPQLLSSALWVASLPATFRAFERPSPRRIAGAAALAAGAVLAHPFGLLTVAASALCWPIVSWACRADRELAPGTLRVWTAIHVGAAALSAGWLAVFLSSSAYMSRTPVPWEPLGVLVTQLAAGELFENHRAFTGPLALVGLFVALRFGRLVAWLVAACLVVLLVASSEAAITVLRLDLLLSAFKNLQFPRYAMALKPLWFALGGLGLAAGLGLLRRAAAGETPAPRPTARSLPAALLAGPLLLTLVDDIGRLVPRPAGGISALEGSRHEAEEAALTSTLALEASAGTRPLTVAFLRKGMGGGTYPLFSIADAGGRVILDGHVPSVNFRWRIDRRTPGALEMLGVTHVLHDQPLGDNERALESRLDPIGRFGPWTLARLRADPGADTSSPPLDLPPAAGRLIEAQAERIQLELLGTGSTEVRLALAPYRKWVARDRDGETVPLVPAEARGGVPGTGLVAPAPGQVTLTYEVPDRERAAAWISAIAIVCAVAAFAFGRPLPLAVRRVAPGAVRLSWALGAAALVLAVAVAVRRQQVLLAASWAPVTDQRRGADAGPDAPSPAFVRDVVAAGDYRVSLRPAEICDGVLTKDSMPGCSAAEQRPRVSMTYRAPFLYRCLQIDIPPRGTAVIEVEDLKADETVIGFFKRLSRGRGEERLTWGLEGGALRPTRSSRHHLEIGPDEHAGTLALEFDNQNTHDERICISLAGLR